jgi:Cu(I)/Ag(I) efflux system membrane fusion protein
MARIVPGILLSVGMIIAVHSVGCSKSTAPTKATGQPQAAATPADDEAADIAKAIALLPEAERHVALAQKICPVGDGPLGSMGMPYKVTVSGRDVYLCCEGCKESIEKDPDKYLAKLDAQAK